MTDVTRLQETIAHLKEKKENLERAITLHELKLQKVLLQTPTQVKPAKSSKKKKKED